MNMGLKIKELRKKAGLTQVDFAKRVGVGLRFIRDLEQGKKTVRMDKVHQLLEYFGYHLEAVKNDRK
ncbi:MAG: type II toxin-antitoxin system Y4mF family antitoxin [bacterium]